MKHQNPATTLDKPSSNFASRLLHRAMTDRKKTHTTAEKFSAPDDAKYSNGQKMETQTQTTEK